MRLLGEQMASGRKCFFLFYLTLVTAKQKEGLVRDGNSSSSRGCCEGRTLLPALGRTSNFPSLPLQHLGSNYDFLQLLPDDSKASGHMKLVAGFIPTPRDPESQTSIPNDMFHGYYMAEYTAGCLH